MKIRTDIMLYTILWTLILLGGATLKQLVDIKDKLADINEGVWSIYYEGVEPDIKQRAMWEEADHNDMIAKGQ